MDRCVYTMMRRSILLLFLVSCGHLPPDTPRVEVTRLAATEAWRVRYVLPVPSEQLAFLREGHVFRGATWRVVSPQGTTWRTEGRREILDLGGRRREVVIEFASDFVRRDKGYDFAIAFSDGARLLYTGFLSIAPSHRWTFGSERRDRIMVLDRIATGSLRWQPAIEPEDGTYVYFGSQEPVRSARMTAMIDAGLPDWIEKQIETTLPRQIDFFSTLLQTELNFRPVIFVSWGGAGSSGRTFKGGTLEGLLAVSLSGEQWVTETREASIGWFHHLAHESFHFWDGEMFEPKPNDAEWLSESAAEYMALVASRESGLIDAAGFERALTDYARRCEAFSRADFRSYYTCGPVIQHAADRAAGGRIAEVYRRTFVQHYTTERFLENLRALATDLTALADVETAIHEGRIGRR